MSQFFEFLGNLLQNFVYQTIRFFTRPTTLLFSFIGAIFFEVLSLGISELDWQLGQVYFSQFTEMLHLYQPYQFLMDYYFGISVLFSLVVDLSSLFLAFFFFVAYKSVMMWAIDLLMKWDICKI